MLVLFRLKFSALKSTKRNPLPPWGPEALRSSASGTTVWAWRWLCTPTPEYQRWSSEHLEASRSSAAQLRGHTAHSVNEHFNATRMPEHFQKAAVLE